MFLSSFRTQSSSIAVVAGTLLVAGAILPWPGPPVSPGPQATTITGHKGQLQKGLGVDSLRGGIDVSTPASSPGEGSIAIGRAADSQGNHSIAVGDAARCLGNGAVSIGQGAASRLDGIAIGRNATADAQSDGGVAIGRAARTSPGPTGDYAIAIGKGAGTGGGAQGVRADSVAIGRDTAANNSGGLAIGALARSDGTNSVTLGREGLSGSGSDDGVAVGYRSRAYQQQSIAIGSEALAGGNPSMGGNASHRQCIAIGPQSSAISPQSIALGHQAAAGTLFLQNQVAVGTQARSEAENGVAIGFGSNLLGSFTDGIAIGTLADGVGDEVIALGARATAQGDDAVAIGPDSSVVGAGGVAIGSGATVTMPDTARIGASGVGVLHDLKVQAYTGRVFLQGQQTNLVITNQGAQGSPTDREVFLPPASAGRVFHFLVQDSDGMKITVSTGDTMTIGTQQNLTRICSSVIGTALTLVAVNDSQWMALSFIGTWTYC